MKLNIKNNFKKISVIKILAVSVLLGGCSSSLLDNSEGEQFALLPADDMMQGPGIFSGEKGAFYIIDPDKKVEKPAVRNQSSVSNMNLNETSKVLDDKIRQLEKDQLELELLKREVDKKIKTQ